MNLINLPNLSAAPILLDFEDVPGSTRLTNQYLSRGVAFDGNPVVDYSTTLENFAHSGSKAIELCWSLEHECTSPLRAQFNTDQSHVKVWVGYSTGTTQPILISLKAYNAQGSLLGQRSFVFQPPSVESRLDAPLEISFPQPSIRFVTIGNGTSDNANQRNIVIDDLEFDSAGSVVCPPGTQDPILNVINPPPGATVRQFNNFLLEGNVNTQTPLLSAMVKVTSPAGIRSQDLLSLVPRLGEPGFSNYFGTNLGSYLSPGTNQITVTVQNCHGASTQTRTINYTPIQFGTRFNFLGIEVTQAIQDMDNTVTLFADKRTFARAYLDISGPITSLNDVSATLSAYRPDPSSRNEDGEYIGTITSLNQITLSSSSLLTKRSDLDLSLNFELPRSWITAGSLHFVLTPSVEGRPLGGVISVVPCDDLRLSNEWRGHGCSNLNQVGSSTPVPRFVSFVNGFPLRIGLFDVPYTINGVTSVPSLTDHNLLVSWLARAYPVTHVIVTDQRTTGTFDRLPSCEELNFLLAFFYGLSNSFPFTNPVKYYGLVSSSLLPPNTFMRGCAGDIVASGPTGNNAPQYGWDTDGSYGDWYGGHEIGHLLGRGHAAFGDSCDGIPDNPDLGYPYPNGSISSSDQRYFGFDVGDPSVNVDTDVYPPNMWTDVMTYRCNEWISDYTYTGIADRLLFGEIVSSAVSSGSEPNNITNMTLTVVGNLDLNSSSVTLGPLFVTAEGNLTKRPEVSPYTINLLSSNGSVLANYPIVPKKYSDTVSGERQFALISESIPYMSGVKEIKISKGEETLVSRNVSANPPRIEIKLPVEGTTLGNNSSQLMWTGEDPDGDKLTYSILYSSDAGRTWLPIASMLNASQYSLNLSAIPGSNNATFRVIASDGVNTAINDTGLVTVPFHAPNVTIISPADNANFSSIQTIIFSGESNDLEDSYLDGKQLQWISDKEGLLGTGKIINVTGMHPGKHNISLVAQDSSGLKSKSSVNLTIEASPPIAIASINFTSTPNHVLVIGNNSVGVGNLSFQWDLVSKPNGSKSFLTSQNESSTMFSPDVPGEYNVQLLVTDSLGLKGTDSVTTRHIVPHRVPS